ncbi:hypothetical protein HRZ66_003559 [Salmonella enterica]|nr:hypothetical protein [Salmonella enterica]EJY6501056.1 hypothetical protein [Salmonella enterica subsp. enterica serovar Johannesburg]
MIDVLSGVQASVRSSEGEEQQGYLKYLMMCRTVRHALAGTVSAGGGLW